LDTILIRLLPQELARKYGRYGYCMITGMLNQSGWQVNHKRVERIWKREGLSVSIWPHLL